MDIIEVRNRSEDRQKSSRVRVGVLVVGGVKLRLILLVAPMEEEDVLETEAAAAAEEADEV